MSSPAIIVERDIQMSLLSPDEAHSEDEPNQQKLPQKPMFGLPLKYVFVLRTIVFILLELPFLILASLATVHPIPLNLPSNISPTAAKGALTLVSLAWQALAIFFVKDIIICIFSSEWANQYHKLGKLVPGETDIVSRMTAGLTEQIQHFISTKATTRYRLAFVSSILLMAVNSLGPSSITINPTPVTYPSNVSVANVQIDSQGDNSPEHAKNIATMEQVDKTTYGFRTIGNMLVPWPDLNLLSANGTIRYQSDVVTYNFSCTWRRPIFSNTSGNWGIEGLPGSMPLGWVHYFPDNWPFPRRAKDPSIIPLIPLGTLPDDQLSLSNFAFIGRNTTLSGNQDIILDLDGLPTAPSLWINSSDPLAAVVLSCNPQFQIFPATVQLSRGTLRAYPHPGPPSVKNIDQQAVNRIFTRSLVGALSDIEISNTWIISNIAGILFLSSPLFSQNPVKADHTKPLPLHQINEKMNQILASTAKAYISGYRTASGFLSIVPTSLPFNLVSTSATMEKEVLALVGSKPFLIVFASMLGILVPLLGALLILINNVTLQTFDLENVVKILYH